MPSLLPSFKVGTLDDDDDICGPPTDSRSFILLPVQQRKSCGIESVWESEHNINVTMTFWWCSVL